MVIGILRTGAGRSGLELRKRLLGILRDIYYRIYYYDEPVSGEH